MKLYHVLRVIYRDNPTNIVTFGFYATLEERENVIKKMQDYYKFPDDYSVTTYYEKEY